MKKQLVYTESEYDTFLNFITFLNKLSDELDDEYELTRDREEILDKARNIVTAIMDFFPVEDNWKDGMKNESICCNSISRKWKWLCSALYFN